MQQPHEKNWCRVDGAGAWRMFGSDRALRLLETFMRTPCSCAEAAASAGLPLATTHRLVTRMAKVGALRVVEIRRRACRPTQIYAAVADALFVPFDRTGDELPDEALRRLLLARVDQQVAGLTRAARLALGRQAFLQWGTVLYLDREHRLVARPDYWQGRTPRLLDRDQPAYLNFHIETLRLPASRAKELQRELVNLVKRYKDFQSGGVHTLSIVLAPKG